MWLMMALLAELRCTPYQCPRLNRTMGVMTDRALFEDRLVFPQERSTFFGMAGITIFIHRELAQF